MFAVSSALMAGRGAYSGRLEGRDGEGRLTRCLRACSRALSRPWFLSKNPYFDACTWKSPGNRLEDSTPMASIQRNSKTKYRKTSMSAVNMDRG